MPVCVTSAIALLSKIFESVKITSTCTRVTLLCFLTTSTRFTENLTECLEVVGKDMRRNTWLRARIPDNTELRDYIKASHETWNSMSDESVGVCKETLRGILREDRDVWGMTCDDFIYLFTKDATKHYFISINDPAWLYVYEGECDMHIAPCADFSFIRDMALSVF